MTFTVADHTTWCSKDVKAGVNLAKILNEIGDAAMIGRVNAHIERFTKRASALYDLKSYKEYFLTQLYHDTLLSIKMALYPKQVQSHLNNLITTKFRQAKKK